MLGQIIISNSQGVIVKTFKVDNLRTYIGKDKNCDIRVELQDIAPQHCLIIMPKSGFPATVRNLSQNNPTLINGQVIGAADFELKDNDVLTVGTRKFEWKYCERNILDKQNVKKCMKRKRKSEPAPKQRLVAVVSPQRSDEKDLPPKKRRRTMFTNLPSSSGTSGVRECVAPDLVNRRTLDKAGLDVSRRNVEAIRASFSNIKKTATNRLLYTTDLSSGTKSNSLNSRIPLKMNHGKGKPMQNLQSNIWQGNLVMLGNNYLNVVQTPHVGVTETSNISQTPVDVISSNTVIARNSSNAKSASFNKKNINKVIASKISAGKKSSLPKKNITPVAIPIQNNKNSPSKITTKLPSIVTPRQNEVNENKRRSKSASRIMRSSNTRFASKIKSPPKNKLSWKHTEERSSSAVGKIFLNLANTPANKKSMLKVKQNKSSLLLKAHTSLTRLTSVHYCKKGTPKMLTTTGNNNSSLRKNEKKGSNKVDKAKRSSKTVLVNSSPKSSNTSSPSNIRTPKAYYTPEARSPKMERSMKNSGKSSTKSKSITFDKGNLNSAKNSKNKKSLKVKKVISSAIKKQPPLVARQSKRSSTLSPYSSSTQSSYLSLRSENTPNHSVKSNTSKSSRLSNSTLKISKNIIPETAFEQKSLNSITEKELSSPKNMNTISETTVVVTQGQVTPVNEIKPNIVMRSSKKESLRRRIFDNSLNPNSEDNLFTDSLENDVSPNSSRTSSTEKQIKVHHKSPVNRSSNKMDISQNRSPASGPRTPPNKGSLVVVMRSSKRDTLKKQLFNRSVEENKVNRNETPIKPSSLNSSIKSYKFDEKELKLSDVNKNSSTNILELNGNKKKSILQKCKRLSDITQEGNNRISANFLDTSRTSRNKTYWSNTAKTQSMSDTKAPISEQNNGDTPQLNNKESSVSTIKQIKTNVKKYIDKREFTKSLDMQQVKRPTTRKCNSAIEMLSPKKRNSNIGKMRSVAQGKSEEDINKLVYSKISSSKLKDLQNESVNPSQEITSFSVSPRSATKLKQLNNNSSISLVDSLEISSPESSMEKSRQSSSETNLLSLKQVTSVQTRKMLYSGNSTTTINKTLDSTLSQGKKITSLKENNNSEQSVLTVKFIPEPKPFNCLIENTRQSTNRSAKNCPQTGILDKYKLQKRYSSSLLDITSSKIITSTPRVVGRTPVKPVWELLSETTNQSTVSRRSTRLMRSNSAAEVAAATENASFIDHNLRPKTVKKLKWGHELSPIGKRVSTKDNETQGYTDKSQKVPLKRSESLSSIKSNQTDNTRATRSASLTSITSTQSKFSPVSSAKSQSALSDQKNGNSAKKSVQKQKETSSKKKIVEIHSSIVDRMKEERVARKCNTSTNVNTSINNKPSTSTNEKIVNNTSTPIRTTKKKLIFDIDKECSRSDVKEKSTSPKGNSPRQSNKNTEVAEVSQVKSRKGKLHTSLREMGRISWKKNHGRQRAYSLPSVNILYEQKKPTLLSNKKNKKLLESPDVTTKKPKVTPAKGNVTPKNTIVPKVTLRSSKRSAVPKITYSPDSTPKSAIIVRRNAMTERKKSFKITIPAMKRKLDALCLEKSKAAAKKLKSEPPKSLDKKKVAALLLCHKKKSPIKEVKKPLNADITKKNDSQESPKRSSSLEKKSPKKAELSFKCSSPIVKKLRFATANDSTATTNLAIINRKKTPRKKFTNKEQTNDKSPSVSEIIEEETAQVDDIFSALYLSRKTTSTAEQKTEKPYRRLRSSVNKLKNSNLTESSQSVQNVKHVAFATPLADYSVSGISNEHMDFTPNTSSFQKKSEQLYEIDDKNVAKNINQIDVQSDYENVSSIKNLMTSKPEPDYTNVSGVKKTLHITSEADYSTYISGIKPTLQMSPQPDYSNVSGVKKTLHPTPDADYTNVSDLKRNLHISPQADYTDVTGVKDIFALKSVSEYNLVPQRVFTTSPVANYTDVTGIKRLFTVPRTAENINTRGLKELFPTDNANYLNVSGVRELFKDPSSSPVQNENQNYSATVNVDATESTQTITRSRRKIKIKEQLSPPATRQLRSRSEKKKTLTSCADSTKKSSPRAQPKVNEQIIVQEKCLVLEKAVGEVLATTKEKNKGKLAEPDKPLRRGRSAKNIILESSPVVVTKRRRGKTAVEKLETKKKVSNTATKSKSTVKKVTKNNVEEIKNNHNSEEKMQPSPPPMRQTRNRSRVIESSNNTQNKEIRTITQRERAQPRGTRKRRSTNLTNKSSNVSNNGSKVSARRYGLSLVSSLKRMNRIKNNKSVHFELDCVEKKKRASQQNEMELKSADRTKRITRNESNKQKLTRQSVSPAVSTKLVRGLRSQRSQTKRKSIERKELPERRNTSNHDSSTLKVNTRRATKKK